MVLDKNVAQAVSAAFKEIFEGGYLLIERIALIDKYEGDDNASMAENNTSAFNYRLKTSGSSLSRHSFGTAIDINPRQNPYVLRSKEGGKGEVIEVAPLDGVGYAIEPQRKLAAKRGDLV
jgi:hypothetical protein